MKIGFIGGGNMAEAMLSALLKEKLTSVEDIHVSDIAEVRRAYLELNYHVTVVSENLTAIENKDVILLAIKPQVFTDAATSLKGRIQPDTLVLSILAGKNLNSICSGLAHRCVVRSMPNTPAQIGEGMTVWTATPQVSPKQKNIASSILGAMGKQIFLEDEKYLDMATAVSGSGPAYIFLFVESMVKAAENLGFSAELSHELVLQTFLGACQLLKRSGKSPQELRRMVTSPGGTTAEAIEVFEQGGIIELVTRAIAAAHEKAKKLGG